MADQEVERRDSSSSGGMADQEVQRRQEATRSPENKKNSWYFLTFLLVMTVLSITIGIGFARWVENSNSDASAKKSNMGMINGFYQWLRN